MCPSHIGGIDQQEGLCFTLLFLCFGVLEGLWLRLTLSLPFHRLLDSFDIVYLVSLDNL
jgi:hypothetical protein